MKKRLLKIANILLIIGLILAIIVMKFINEWKFQAYTQAYEREIDNLQQNIPQYKIYEQANQVCTYEVLYDLKNADKHKKIQKSCEALQKAACDIYNGQPNCLSATISNAENKAGLKKYEESLVLLKEVEQSTLDYFNNRQYYDPDPSMINFDLYSAYSKIYFKMGDYKKAESYTEMAAKWGQKEFEPHSGLANYGYMQLADNYFEAKNYKKALEYYKKIRVTYTFGGFIKHPGFALQDFYHGPIYAKKQIELCNKKLNEK